jgi:dienelactone hydrolase
MPSGRPLMLLHSAYGLRPAIRDTEARLAAAGFVVEAPDLYGGRTADRLEDALALRDRLDRTRVLAELAGRAEALRVRCGGAPLTLVGFSYGASRALDLALGEPGRPREGQVGVAAVVLFHGTSDVGRPHGAGPLPLRVLGHFGQADPWEPAEEVDQVAARLRAAGAAVTVHRYAGAGHMFTDPGLPEFDPAATALAWRRTLAWLGPSP